MAEQPARLGRYEVRETLGKGAMGVVYKAFDPDIERTVALKTIRTETVDPDLAAQFLARFRNEAKAAGRLSHPNIVAIYEYGEEGGVAFIAMEFVDGIGLREYLNRGARFELAQIAAIMGQLLQALDFAHGRGVVHRDVKPANLILARDGTLKVADFGVARIDTSSLTMAGSIVGTPSYMSPEQCRGEPADRRSDLWSAGVVFYELLAGQRPFAGAAESLAYQICHRAPRPVSACAKVPLPPGIDALLDKAMAKSPEERFQDAREFATALHALLAGPGAPESTLDATVLNLAQVPLTAPAQPWDDTLIGTVERELAHYLGPVARVLVRKASAQTRDLNELYAILAANITDVDQRRRFVAQRHAADASSPRGGSQPGTRRTGESGAGAHSQPSGTKPNPLDPAFVEATTSRLAVYIGPIAKVVARRAAQQAKSPQEFVQLVAAHIGTQDRLAFLREAGFGGG